MNETEQKKGWHNWRNLLKWENSDWLWIAFFILIIVTSISYWDMKKQIILFNNNPCKFCTSYLQQFKDILGRDVIMPNISNWSINISNG